MEETEIEIFGCRLEDVGWTTLGLTSFLEVFLEALEDDLEARFDELEDFDVDDFSKTGSFLEAEPKKVIHYLATQKIIFKWRIFLF